MDEPWKPADATEKIRAIARNNRLSLAYKVHAVQREGERGIYTPDVLYLLKNGFVHDEATAATRAGFFKYAIEGLTPNSEGRGIRLIVIPDAKNFIIKIVTVMWIDDTTRRAGTLIGET